MAVWLNGWATSTCQPQVRVTVDVISPGTQIIDESVMVSKELIVSWENQCNY